MKKSSVIALKQEVLSDVRERAAERVGAGAQSLVHPQPANRIAAGFSQRSKGDFWLELRVQRMNGAAHRRALEIQTEIGSEVNIDVIPRIEIPSKNILFESDPQNSISRRLCGRQRPLHIGLSIGHNNGGSGTLGAFVETSHGDGILSNNHVLALMGQASIQDPVFQPGRPNQRVLTSKDRVARLSVFGEITRAFRNEVDCAVASIDPNVEYSGNAVPRNLGTPVDGLVINRFLDPAELSHEMEVCKIGSTTGFTTGRVSAIALDGVPVWTSIGNVVFDDVLEISWESTRTPFTRPGDSGSVVFTKEGCRAVGLHFAGGNLVRDGRQTGVSYACNLGTALESLDASLLD